MRAGQGNFPKLKAFECSDLEFPRRFEGRRPAVDDPFYYPACKSSVLASAQPGELGAPASTGSPGRAAEPADGIPELDLKSRKL